jgi:hypothetical protein
VADAGEPDGAAQIVIRMVTAGHAPWLIFLPTIIALNSNSTPVRPREPHPMVNEPARSENLTNTSSRSPRAHPPCPGMVLFHKGGATQ